jgi:hypothetical protein
MPRGAGPLVTGSVEVVLRHHAALLQLVEQERDVSGDRALALVLLQQGETRALEPPSLRLRRGQPVSGGRAAARGRGWH